MRGLASAKPLLAWGLSDTRPHATARRPTQIKEGRGGDQTEGPRVLRRKVSLRGLRDAVRPPTRAQPPIGPTAINGVIVRFSDLVEKAHLLRRHPWHLYSDGEGNADGDNGRHVESLASPELGAAAPLPGGAFWERARATGLVLGRCDPATGTSSGAHPLYNLINRAQHLYKHSVPTGAPGVQARAASV